MKKSRKKFPIIVNYCGSKYTNIIYRYFGPIYIIADSIEAALAKACELSEDGKNFRISDFYVRKDPYSWRREYTTESINSAFERFQTEIVNAGYPYILNNMWFKENRFFPLKGEILEMIPECFREKLKDAEIEIDFEAAVIANLETHPIDSMLELESAVIATEFIDFVYRAFSWNLTPSNAPEKDFKWWFRKIFNRDFSHPYYTYKEGYFPIFNNKSRLNFEITSVYFVKADSIEEAYKIAVQTIDDFIDTSNESLSLQSQLIYEFEKRIDSKGFCYYFDTKFYDDKKRILTTSEILNKIPIEFKEDFENLHLIDIFVDELNHYYDSLLLPESIDTLKYFEAVSSMKHQNVASFIYVSFPWLSSKRGFNQWYELVFGSEYTYRLENEIIHEEIQRAIINFDIENASNAYYRNNYTENDSYSYKQAFYDAYGDGFSREESERYWEAGAEDE